MAARKPLHRKRTSEHPQQKSKTVPDISSRAESKLDETRHEKVLHGPQGKPFCLAGQGTSCN